MIELGVPFSDPLADGGTIQKANTDALNNGVTLKDCLNYVKDARSKGFHTPVVLMGYYNPFMQYGEEKLVKGAVLVHITSGSTPGRAKLTGDGKIDVENTATCRQRATATGIELYELRHKSCDSRITIAL